MDGAFIVSQSQNNIKRNAPIADWQTQRKAKLGLRKYSTRILSN